MDTEVLDLVLGVYILVALPGLFVWGGYERRRTRDPGSLIVTEAGATVIRPSRTHGAGVGLTFWAGSLVLLMAPWLVKASFIGVLLLAFGAYLVVVACLFGRIGDGTLHLTADGLSQRQLGVEQVVEWKDITGFELVKGGLLLRAPGSVISRRLVPLPWIGQRKFASDFFLLRTDNIHPDTTGRLYAMIPRWAGFAWERSVFGTDEAVEALTGP